MKKVLLILSLIIVQNSLRANHSPEFDAFLEDLLTIVDKHVGHVLYKRSDHRKLVDRSTPYDKAEECRLKETLSSNPSLQQEVVDHSNYIRGRVTMIINNRIQKFYHHRTIMPRFDRTMKMVEYIINL